jgi:hypothetical protein
MVWIKETKSYESFLWKLENKTTIILTWMNEKSGWSNSISFVFFFWEKKQRTIFVIHGYKQLRPHRQRRKKKEHKRLGPLSTCLGKQVILNTSSLVCLFQKTFEVSKTKKQLSKQKKTKYGKMILPFQRNNVIVLLQS